MDLFQSSNVDLKTLGICIMLILIEETELVRTNMVIKKRESDWKSTVWIRMLFSGETKQQASCKVNNKDHQRDVKNNRQ